MAAESRKMMETNMNVQWQVWLLRVAKVIRCVMLLQRVEEDSLDGSSSAGRIN